jgi:RNA-binding protein
MQTELTNAEIRKLKARAQLLEAAFKVGKAGLSGGFVQGVDAAFEYHDLIKVKFAGFKDEKKLLAEQLAGQTSSRVIMQVGHVVVLYRPLPAKAEAPGARPGGGASPDISQAD